MTDQPEADLPVDPDVEALSAALAAHHEGVSDDGLTHVEMGGDLHVVGVSIAPGTTRQSLERDLLAALQRSFDAARGATVQLLVAQGWIEQPPAGPAAVDEGARATVGAATIVLGTDMRPLRVELAHVDGEDLAADVAQAFDRAFAAATPFDETELEADVDERMAELDATFSGLLADLDGIHAELGELDAQLDASKAALVAQPDDLPRE